MTDTGSKISFVMPAYNCARTIEEAAASIMNGNFNIGDELIIVDDGSVDGTDKIIAWLKERFAGIRHIKNPHNLGCPATRNIGIRAAKNPLIFNMDADDVLVPGSIDKLKKQLIDDGADISAFGEIHFFKGKPGDITHKWLCKTGIMTLADYLAGQIVPGGNYLYTKASWEKIGGYWEYGKGLHEFWGFTLKQLANGAKMTVLGKTHYLHRYGTGDSLFVRETQRKEESSAMATKMIMNLSGLIDDEDLLYIQDAGNDWFGNLSKRPIRLKSGEAGTTGTKISIKQADTLRSVLGKIIPPSVYEKLKKKKLCLSFRKDFKRFKEASDGAGRFPALSWQDRKARLFDNTPNTAFDYHYIYHPAWAARIIKKINSETHIDISSTLSFSSMLSAFVPVEFYDYRPANIKLDGLESKKADLLCLPFKSGSIRSISCMHTVEHIGLGRYGDPMDQEADLKAIKELKRVTAPGGNLIFVVPVGRPKIAFNAHRIYSYGQILSYFKGFRLQEFSLIPDSAERDGIVANATQELADKQRYGCGCFWFIKN